MVTQVKKLRPRTLVITAGVLLSILIGWFAYEHWRLGWRWANWTGFENKTLWEWMELLVIPFAVALGAFWLEQSERRSDRKNAEDYQNEVALQTYFDKMTEFMLNDNRDLNELAEHGSKVISIINYRTWKTFERLDPKRKKILLQFLLDNSLVCKKEKEIEYEIGNPQLCFFPPTIDLRRIDFRNVDLSGMRLQDLVLSNVNLCGACLKGATIENTDLSEAKLNDADLSSAKLRNVELVMADMRRTNLNHAHLSNVKFWGADLRNADLRYTDLRTCELSSAKLNKANLWDAVFCVNEDVDQLKQYEEELRGSMQFSICITNQLTGIIVRESITNMILRHALARLLEFLKGTNHLTN